MMHFKNHDGFTLIEVIISIAILSVVSVVVLQLFMTSRDLNIQSRHSDIASLLSTNTIETIKTYDDPSLLIEDEDWLSYENHLIDGTLYYDETFTLVDEPSKFKLTCMLEEDLANPGLFAIAVLVTNTEDHSDLAAYTTKHYFKHQEVAYD